MPLTLWSWIAALPLTAHADNTPSTPHLDGSGGLFSQGIFGLGAEPAAATTPSSNNAPGVPCLEILQGNGAGIGYVLSHGNILPQTVRVSAGGNVLLPQRDYWLDAANGTLFFAQPIPRAENISVSYRYLEGQDAQRQPMSVPALQFGMGSSTMAGLFYGMTSGNGSGYDITTYGLNLNSKFGAGGVSAYNGLAYFSHSQRNTNIVANLTSSALTTKAAPATDPGSDHLIAQNLNLRSGGWQVNAEYQDVGKQFGGFSALKLSNAGNKTVLDQLAQLENEKGVKRIGLGFAYQPVSASKGSVPNGLAFDWNQIRDGKGAITQESAGYHTGAFHFDYTALDIGQSFTQFNGLRDADHAQWAKEKGIRSQNLDLGWSFGRGGKAGSLDFSDERMVDTSKTGVDDAGFRRESFTLETPGLGLAYVRRQTGADFSRMSDLSDTEKNNLALDILRQFDPAATLQQVTQKERDQAAKEAGLERDFLGGHWQLGKVGTLAFGSFSIYDTPAQQSTSQDSLRNAIHRQMLSFTGRDLQFSWQQQSISDSFSRLASLSDVERAQFGNEHGLNSQQLTLAWQPNKTTKIGFSSLSAGSTPDAVAAALSAAQQNGQDVQAAARAISARLHRETFTLDTKGLSLAAHFADTGKGFTRGADMALPAADQTQINTEAGYRRSDYTLHFAMLKGLTIDSSDYNAVDALDNLRHDTYKQNLQYTSARGLQLAYSADGDVATSAGMANGLTHSHLALNQTFNKGMQLALTQDDSTTYSNGVVSQALHTQDLHFQTDQKQPNAALFDDQRVSYQDGTFLDTVNVNIHAKPSKQFAFDYTKQQIDSDVPNDPSANTDTIDFEWEANKQFAMTGSVSQSQVGGKPSADTVSLGLKGQPCKDIAVDAKLNEVHQDAKDTKDVADVSLSNPKPFTLGPIQELTLSARYASLNDQHRVQNETVTGRASWKLWKNQFLLDYGGLTPQYGQTTITRTYSFLTDPNPKKWFHASILYKDRSLYTGEEQLIRRFALDARLSKTMQFSYLFGTLPEDEKGNVTPQTTANVSLKDTLLPGLSGELFYRSQDNTATKILTRSLGFGFEGKVSRLGKLQFAYSIDANGTPTTYDHSDHFLLGYSQQVDADHLLNFSVEYRTHDTLGLAQQVTANLDFRTIF